MQRQVRQAGRHRRRRHGHDGARTSRGHTARREQYRPYTSIEQFRREIGKYVDKAEVARLEQYIVIK
ncbi:MAG: hypothetical protein ABJB95_07610 [Gemmatimonadales bacterium]